MSESLVSPLFFEKVLLKYIYTESDVREKILPFLSEDIFDDYSIKENVRTLMKFIEVHEKFPTVPEVKLEINNKETFDSLNESLNVDLSEYDKSYIVEKIEDFFKRKMLLNELSSAHSIISDKDLGLLSEVPEKIREKMSFSFNTEIGLNLFSESGASRFFEHLHTTEKYIPTEIPYIDRIIDGGFHEKTLNLFLAPTGVGKSTNMCSLAVRNVYRNKKVLYVSLEMSENRIAERLIANFFDIDIKKLKDLSEDSYKNKFNEVLKKFKDKLILKEYPAKSMNANRLRNLLKELKIKLNFVPDIIYLDYLGIMAPNSMKAVNNSYEILKTISEEVRGIATEFSVPIVSAVQTNRDGIGSALIDLTDIADSIGITATADLIIGITQTPEFKEAGKYNWLILKNRYGINGLAFKVNVDFSKMRVFADEDQENETKNNENKIDLVDQASVDILTGVKKDKRKKLSDFTGIDMSE